MATPCGRLGNDTAIFLRTCVFQFVVILKKCLQRMREDLQQRNKKATLACNRQFDLSNEGNFLDLFYSMAFASGLSEWELGIVNLLRVSTVTSLEPQALP